jgi:hypothetical protein
MNMDRAVLAWYQSPYWLPPTGFVGLNLLQAYVVRSAPCCSPDAVPSDDKRSEAS